MQVLSVFKTLHRTRMAVFKDDDIGLKGEIVVAWYYSLEKNICCYMFDGCCLPANPYKTEDN